MIIINLWIGLLLFALHRTLVRHFVLSLLGNGRVRLLDFENFRLFLVRVSLPPLRFMDLLAENLMIKLAFIVRRVIAFNNLHEFGEKLLGMSANVSDSARFHVLLN